MNVLAIWINCITFAANKVLDEMKRKQSQWLFLLVIGLFGACTSSLDEKEAETDIDSALLQNAFYIAVDDSLQPVWLQEMIKSVPYLKVYHSDKDGGLYFVEHPDRAQTTGELYHVDGRPQTFTTPEGLDAAISAAAPWTCTHIYSYPIVAGTDEWKALSILERNERLQLPDNLLGTIRTEDLIEVCLDYPYALNYGAYDDFQSGFMGVYNQFNGLRELLSRSDLTEPFLLRLDINWQKASLMSGMGDTDPIRVGKYSLLSCLLFKIMLAQDAVLNQMSKNQLRRMLDLCMRNTSIEVSYSEIWGGVAHEGTMFIYAKVIHNNGGFSFKDEEEKNLFNEYVQCPSEIILRMLLTDDFIARVMEYVEKF